jgi:hypothetical protein
MHMKNPVQTGSGCIRFISSLLQGKHLPFTPSPLRLNIFRLFMILSLTQLYRYSSAIYTPNAYDIICRVARMAE